MIHKDFRLNSRPLQVSRLLGSGLDTMAAEGASMSVARSLEDMLLSTTAIVVGGNTIYGYINHPNRNTIDLAEMWDNVATTGQDIFEDVQADGFGGARRQPLRPLRPAYSWQLSGRHG